MRWNLTFVCLWTLGLAGSCPAAQEWGDLTATFLYDGDPPKAPPVQVTSDKDFCGKFHLLDESLVVNAKNHGVAYVVAYLYLTKNAAKPAVHASYEASSAEPVKLDNDCCRFAPHVALMRPSQTLVLTNSDSVGHNCKVDTWGANPAFNYTIPVDGKMTHKFAEEEKMPVKVSCSIHPWMGGWLVIRDSPYMAASDENGKLLIKNLPVGKWTFQFWHEKAGFVRKVEQNGRSTEWPKGRLDVTIKSGNNSLGEIKLSPAAFTE